MGHDGVWKQRKVTGQIVRGEVNRELRSQRNGGAIYTTGITKLPRIKAGIGL